MLGAHKKGADSLTVNSLGCEKLNVLSRVKSLEDKPLDCVVAKLTHPPQPWRPPGRLAWAKDARDLGSLQPP